MSQQREGAHMMNVQMQPWKCSFCNTRENMDYRCRNCSYSRMFTDWLADYQNRAREARNSGGSLISTTVTGAAAICELFFTTFSISFSLNLTRPYSRLPVGGCVGAVFGAVAGQMTHRGAVTGSGLGALAGAAVSMELVDWCRNMGSNMLDIYNNEASNESVKQILLSTTKTSN